MNAVDRIEEFNRFGSVLGLERMNVLMELLGNPQEALKVIHVAGTNGKGSVSRYIYETLEANGYKVGLFTSPFIEIFNERIEYDHEYISDEELEAVSDKVLEKVKEMTDKGYDSPTEFEVITAIAFVYFKSKDPDFVILEVGLGGRGDSTNIVKKPLATIITSIGYDHMDRLGGTLAEIAAEKAGIVKAGVLCFSNAEDIEAKKVIARKCYETGAGLYDITKIKPVFSNEFLGGSRAGFVIDGIRYDDLEISMSGSHQIKNLKCALSCIEYLRRKGYISLDKNKFLEGIKRAKQIGRFEILEENPYVILDGAHNKDGAKALYETMSKYFKKEEVLIVCGMLKDKDVSGICEMLGRISDNFILTEPLSDRKLSKDELAEHLKKKGCICETASSREDAFKKAMERKSDFKCILFAGSLYLIGEIRRMYYDKGNKKEGSLLL